MIELRPGQKDALSRMGNGKVLFGIVGTGKSIVGLAYYVEREAPKPLIIITTAKKRNTFEWIEDAAKFTISPDPNLSRYGTITVDSWNNVMDYIHHEDCFFIFDEQRLVGSGAWVKAFQKIVKKNNWILLTGTPGDTWMDYGPLFVANGHYKNMTEFKFEHVIYEPFNRYPVIRGYLKERKLEILRNDLLVEMVYEKHTNPIVNYLDVQHNQQLFERVHKDRWHIYEDRPIVDVAEMRRVLRRIINSDPSRLEAVRQLISTHDRLIIFYNFNYELDILRTLADEVNIYEYNGHKKDPVPTGDEWVYLVQYTAGAEGWNCVRTNAMILYSMTHSYKTFIQAMGRIDRLNTSYVDLYYYVLTSNTFVDLGIRRSLNNKEDFNMRAFLRELTALEG